jgi:excisionase family DNA binding protein
MTEKVDIFSVGQAAKVLRVSVRTLHRWDKNGRLKACRDENNARYYTRNQLYELLEKANKVKYERTKST